jgi:tetratricopeptide (TPR) repeat protein
LAFCSLLAGAVFADGEPINEAYQDPVDQLEIRLQAAMQELAANPNSADQLIWVGRLQAYVGGYEEAIKTFSLGVEQFPDDARFLRHRGHRWITLREFDKAIEDLESAAKRIDGTEDEIEPDGQPNAAGIPTSTLHTNIWYHLGLANFLKGDFEMALNAYQRCLSAAKNNDMRVATLDWQFMTLCRLGRREEADKLIAEITPEMKILENHAYHRRLLMYRGLLTPDDLLSQKVESNADQLSADVDSSQREIELATNGFGVGHWYLIQGNSEKAGEVFRQVVKGKSRAAFGFIAAEVELQRLKRED